VTGHDYVPWFRDVRVIPSQGPTLVPDSLMVMDSAGDGTGRADAGERIELELGLMNIGFDPALSWPAPSLARSRSGHRDRNLPYGDIAPGEAGVNQEPFRVRLAGNVSTACA